MAIVSSIDDDWTIHLLESNWNDDQKVHTTRTLKPWDSRIFGYYRPQASSNASFDTWYYNPNYSEIYGKFLQWKFSAWNQLENTAKSLWISVDELRSQADAWKSSQNSNVEVLQRLDAIQRLLWQNISRVWRIASESSAAQFADQNLADWDAAFNYIRDNISFEKLLELKKHWATFGALSDNELRAIWNSATSLRRNMSQEEFEKKLTGIYNWLLKWIWRQDQYTTQQIKDLYKNWGNLQPVEREAIPSWTGWDAGDLSDLLNL